MRGAPIEAAHHRPPRERPRRNRADRRRRSRTDDPGPTMSTICRRPSGRRRAIIAAPCASSWIFPWRGPPRRKQRRRRGTAALARSRRLRNGASAAPARGAPSAASLGVNSGRRRNAASIFVVRAGKKNLSSNQAGRRAKRVAARRREAFERAGRGRPSAASSTPRAMWVFGRTAEAVEAMRENGCVEATDPDRAP